MVSDRFGSFSDRFQTTRNYKFQLARAGARPRRPSEEPSGPSPGQLKLEVFFRKKMYNESETERQYEILVGGGSYTLCLSVSVPSARLVSRPVWRLR